VRSLEEALVAAVVQEGVVARSRPHDGHLYTGVWVEDRKIASIGVHVSRGVTTHGFAVNVENDLEPFSWIVPCGLDGVQMTSLIRETGRTPSLMKCFRRRASFEIARALGLRQRLVSWTRLESVAPGRQRLVSRTRLESVAPGRQRLVNRTRLESVAPGRQRLVNRTRLESAAPGRHLPTAPAPATVT
jgi:hypothetical protein